jgi:NAD+ kinase
MKVAIYGRKANKLNLEFYIELLGILKDFGWTPVFEEKLKEILIKRIGLSQKAETFSSPEDLRTGIDLSLSIGGDGTFMQNVKYVRDSEVPVLGINTGRLGFLANVSRDYLEEAMDMVYNKKFVHQKRSLLRIETDAIDLGEDNMALNELTLQKKDTSSMITVNVSLEDKYLNSYWADGLILSTPTGSTAYNLSCGGPIVTPGCQVHILTPIAPHNLTVRPMVVPDHMPIKLSIEGRNRTNLLSLDGSSHSIKNGGELTVYKGDFMINVIKFEDNNFLDTIRNKMSWGLDQRN